MSNEVGLRLKEVRRELKLTQKQLGENLGIKATTLAKHERGFCFPTGKMLEVLASKYHVSMDYLLCGRGTLFYEEKEPIRKILDEDKELQELISIVSHIPWVRHAVLGFFQKFKLENRELIEKELTNPVSPSPLFSRAL